MDSEPTDKLTTIPVPDDRDTDKGMILPPEDGFAIDLDWDDPEDYEDTRIDLQLPAGLRNKPDDVDLIIANHEHVLRQVRNEVNEKVGGQMRFHGTIFPQDSDVPDSSQE